MIWGNLWQKLCQSRMRAPKTRSNTRSFAWGASQPLLKTKVNIMSQLWLMRRPSRSIWMPRTCGTNGKLMKRATKNIRLTLAEIVVESNCRQKRETPRINLSKGSQMSAQNKDFARYSLFVISLPFLYWFVTGIKLSHLLVWSKRSHCIPALCMTKTHSGGKVYSMLYTFCII